MRYRMFIKNAPNSHGFVNPRDIEDIWRDHFDYFYREYDEFIFPITIHPDVSFFSCDDDKSHPRFVDIGSSSNTFAGVGPTTRDTDARKAG